MYCICLYYVSREFGYKTNCVYNSPFSQSQMLGALCYYGHAFIIVTNQDGNLLFSVICIFTVFTVIASLDKKKYPSVFGSITETRVSSNGSRASYASSSKTEAAAELAAKKAQLESVQEIQAQRDKLVQVQAEFQRKMKEEEDRLERVKAEKEIQIAAARYKVYEDEEERQNTFSGESHGTPAYQEENSPAHTPLQTSSSGGSTPLSSSRASSVELSTMLRAFQESISLGRLPVPEPSTFSGDPMQFPEWKNAFTALIARKHIGAADKLFYLRKYTSGAAAKMIQGAFLRSDEAAYNDAWSKLNTRYGNPFIIQRAFREKIAHWPKVEDNDAKALQDYSDFLSACNDAIPHVKGLSILNDCEENRKINGK